MIPVEHPPSCGVRCRALPLPPLLLEPQFPLLLLELLLLELPLQHPLPPSLLLLELLLSSPALHVTAATM
jgi:hypothetical protein